MTTWVLSWVMWDLSLEHLILLLRCPGLVAQQPCGIIVPWSGMELASPALQGEFLITGPPGKSWNCPFYFQNPISFMKHLLIQGIWGDTIFSIFKQQNFQQSWANVQFSSAQFSRSVVSDSLWPHESQDARANVQDIFIHLHLPTLFWWYEFSSISDYRAPLVWMSMFIQSFFQTNTIQGDSFLCYALFWKLYDYKDELDIQGIQILKIASNGAICPGRYTKACS